MITADFISREIEQIKGQRYQLLIIPERKVNKPEILGCLKQLNIPILNLSLILAEQLKSVPEQKRPREVSSTLRQVIHRYDTDVICFEKIEYLFDPELKQDPLRLLESLSGNKVLIVLWPGDVQDNTLTYATPEHPEFYQKQGYEQYIMRI